MNRKTIVFTILLWVFWIILTASLNLSSLLIGLVSAFLVTLICQALLHPHLERVNMSIGTAFRHLFYIPFLFKEIVKANIDVAERVIDPKLPIDPTVIKFKFPLEEDLPRIALANSITLTPGTLTIDVEDHEFTIHCLAEEHVRGIFEESLQKNVIRLYTGERQ